MYLNKDEELLNCGNKLVGEVERINNYSSISMEIDLRSEKEKRTLKYIVDDVEQRCYFNNLPSEVKFAVSFYIILYYTILCYIMLYYSILGLLKRR